MHGYPSRNGRKNMVRSGEITLSMSITELSTGPIVYLNAVGQPLIVLNTHRAAADLLDKRAAIYSDRPDMIVALDFLTGGHFLVNMHHDASYVS